MDKHNFKIDCSKCCGLCCSALFFSKVDGFPENKKAGIPCSNLQENFFCKIHNKLEETNLKGCIGYDCFGAGQYVTQNLYNGETWLTLKNKKDEIFNVFIIIYQLFQIRYYLEEGKNIIKSNNLINNIKDLILENNAFITLSPTDILKINLKDYRAKVNICLKEVHNNLNIKKLNKVLYGKNFKLKNMNNLDLSMELLIGSNFDGCTFNETTFLGSDTRDANFSNANLSKAFFITQGQINSAKGNKNTRLPKDLDYPVTWK